MDQLVCNVIEVAFDAGTKPLLRLVATTDGGYSFIVNGHWFVRKASDGRCVQFDFNGTITEMAPAVFEAVLAEIRGIIKDF